MYTPPTPPQLKTQDSLLFTLIASSRTASSPSEAYSYPLARSIYGSLGIAYEVEVRAQTLLQPIFWIKNQKGRNSCPRMPGYFSHQTTYLVKTVVNLVQQFYSFHGEQNYTHNVRFRHNAENFMH